MFEYVNENYGLNVFYGQSVIVNGKSGVVVEDRGNHIGVNFDEDKPMIVSNCHPTWKVQYNNESKPIRKLTKSQLRYRAYMEYSDCFDSFKEFLYSDLAKV